MYLFIAVMRLYFYYCFIVLVNVIGIQGAEKFVTEFLEFVEQRCNFG